MDHELAIETQIYIAILLSIRAIMAFIFNDEEFLTCHLPN